jgi:hypothetical protein
LSCAPRPLRRPAAWPPPADQHVGAAGL